MHFVKAKVLLNASNGMNLYRGCTHGCIYCDSRSKCYQIKHKFDDIEVKENSLELLEDKLMRKRKKCMLGLGSMSDPYMPLEMSLEYTRKALLLALKYDFGMTFITKSNLLIRDIDIIKELNEKTKCVVQMTLTTCDDDLCRIIEPNVATTKERFEVLMRLKAEGIPTVVWMTPILPFINDTKANIEGIIDYCQKAGVKGIICFDMGLTLREGNREYFYQNLDQYFPSLKEQYIKRYGESYIISSPHNYQLMKFFKERCSEYGIMHNLDDIFAYLNTYEKKLPYERLSLFDNL